MFCLRFHLENTKLNLNYSTRIVKESTQYLSYFPNPDNIRGFDQKFLLDGKDVNNIKFENDYDYQKILGGLLVDHQTFVITQIDESGNVIKHMCVFNLLQGALSLDPKSGLGQYVARETTTYYQGAPQVVAFDETLYDEADSNSIISVMKSFKDNNVLIGYQRLKDRSQELSMWLDISSQLLWIRNAFK